MLITKPVSLPTKIHLVVDLMNKTQIEDLPEILNVAEACRLLRVSRAKLYELVHSGQLPCIQLSSRIWRFSKRRLLSWLDDRMNPAA